ncbi:unnamed protein product, partial [Prorocentrum cordatum]
GDDPSMWLKPPYHHFREAFAAQAAADLGRPLVRGPAEVGDAAPGPPPGHPQQWVGTQVGQPGDPPPVSGGGVEVPAIDQRLLEEVVQLDLFDHQGVTYKVADLGNACWVDRHFS